MSTDTLDTPVTETPPPAAELATDASWDSDSAKHPAVAKMERQEAVPASDSAPQDTVSQEQVDQAKEAETTRETPERDETGQFKGKGKPKHEAMARLHQATAREAEAKREMAALREENERLKRERQSPPEPQRTTTQTQAEAKAPQADPSWTRPKPTIQDHLEKEDPYAALAEDFANWRWEQGEAARQQEAKRQEMNASFERARADVKDLDVHMRRMDETIAGAGLDGFSPAFLYALSKSGKFGALVQYLGTHPEDCLQWARDTQGLPESAATAVRSVLERVLTAGAVEADPVPAVRPSSATPPIRRVGGSASAVPIEPDDLEFGPDYMTAGNEADRKRKARKW